MAALGSASQARVTRAAQFASYVYAIARRRLIDAARRQRGARPGEQAPLLPDQEEPVNGAIEDEEARWLQGTIAGLPQAHRWALFLRIYAGARWDVVQLVLRCETEHAARCTYDRGRGRLAQRRLARD